MKVIITILCLVGLLLAGETEPIEVDNFYQISPSPGSPTLESSDNNLSVDSPRIILTFDMPENMLAENSHIREATLVVQIEPEAGWDGEKPIMAYCLPVTEPVPGVPTWSSAHDAYEYKYPELGIYKPSRGYIFFEISPMLNAATRGEIDFHGVMIIPTKGSQAFNLADVPEPIDFRAANFIGARATMD